MGHQNSKQVTVLVLDVVGEVIDGGGEVIPGDKDLHDDRKHITDTSPSHPNNEKSPKAPKIAQLGLVQSPTATRIEPSRWYKVGARLRDLNFREFPSPQDPEYPQYPEDPI